jgi:hypothetical protein
MPNTLGGGRFAMPESASALRPFAFAVLALPGAFFDEIEDK